MVYYQKVELLLKTAGKDAANQKKAINICKELQDIWNEAYEKKVDWADKHQDIINKICFYRACEPEKMSELVRNVRFLANNTNMILRITDLLDV